MKIKKEEEKNYRSWKCLILNYESFIYFQITYKDLKEFLRIFFTNVSLATLFLHASRCMMHSI